VSLLVALAVGCVALLASFLSAVAGFGGAVVLLPVLVWWRTSGGPLAMVSTTWSSAGTSSRPMPI
jgi:uncharacterized membrane protein YfcA